MKALKQTLSILLGTLNNISASEFCDSSPSLTHIFSGRN